MLAEGSSTKRYAPELDAESSDRARLSALTAQVQSRHKRRSRRDRAITHSVQVAIVVAVLIAWELASGTLVAEFWISRPTAIAEVLGQWIRDGTLLTNALSTLQAMVLGLVTGSAAGVLVGFWLGGSVRLAAVLDPFVMAIYSLPKVALAPLFILWFGIGMTSKVAMSALLVFFFVFYSTFNGVRNVDQDLIALTRLMGARRLAVLRSVTIPSSAVWIFAGLNLAVPQSLIGAVVGEIIASNQGLGYLLRQSTGSFNTAGTFAALFALMVIGVVINVAVEYVNRRTSRWREANAR